MIEHQVGNRWLPRRRYIAINELRGEGGREGGQVVRRAAGRISVVALPQRLV
jgi:hypothetical protein